MPEPAPSSPEKITREEFPTYRRGRWWPAFALLILPFVFVIQPLYRVVRHELNWRAVAATIACFESFMLCAEHYSLKRGHWVYNEARILGPKIFGIPIEEPLIYYWFPAFIVIVMLLFFHRKIRERGGS